MAWLTTGYMFIRRRVDITAVLLLALLGLTGGRAYTQPSGSHGIDARRATEEWDYHGERLLGHRGFDVCLWDVHTGRMLRTFHGHLESVHEVAFSPNGKVALSSSWVDGGDYPIRSRDTSVRIWDIATGQPRWRFAGQAAGVFAPDSTRVLTYSVEDEGRNAIDLWDVRSGGKIFSVTRDSRVHSYGDLIFQSDGAIFADLSGSYLTLYNASDRSKLDEITM